jgi:hypothetical protein
MLKSAISSSISKNGFFFYFCNFNCRILHYTTRRTCTKKFKKVDLTDCKIITFEVKRKVFFPCAQKGLQTLTARGTKNLNYATLSFFTIVMHIMLGACVPNLRGRWWVEHTQMHPALKKGTNNFHNTNNSCGIFSDLNFSWNKNLNGRYEGLDVL